MVTPQREMDLRMEIATLKAASLRDAVEYDHRIESNDAEWRKRVAELEGELLLANTKLRIYETPSEPQDSRRAFFPVVFAKSSVFETAYGEHSQMTAWQGVSPDRRTRLDRLVIAEPHAGCMLARVELLEVCADVPLAQGPMAIEGHGVKLAPRIIIQPRSPIAVFLTAGAHAVAAVFEDWS